MTQHDINTLNERPLIVSAGLLVAAAAAVSLFLWKAKSDRAGCCMNIRNIQQAMRGEGGMRNVPPGQPGFRKTLIIGPTCYIRKEPICPGGGTYTWNEGNYPPLGTLVVRCSDPSHIPDHYSDW